MSAKIYSYPEHTAPETNEIVLARWPRDDGKPPGFKDRPCLVRRVARHKGLIVVRVAYGTTNMNGRPHDSFPIVKPEDMDLAGLHQATRFVLTEMKWAYWDSRFFRCPPNHPTPVLGRLSDDKLAELASQMKALERRYGPL